MRGVIDCRVRHPHGLYSGRLELLGHLRYPILVHLFRHANLMPGSNWLQLERGRMRRHGIVVQLVRQLDFLRRGTRMQLEHY